MAKKPKAEKEPENQAVVEGSPEIPDQAKPAEESKPKIDYASPEALARYDCETQERCHKQAMEVAEAERSYESAKTEASELKKDLEVQEKRLRLLINERHDRRGKPPVATQLTLTDIAVDGPGSDTWPPSNLWEQFPIVRLEDFGLSKAIIAKLASGEMKKGKDGIGPIETMGAMSRYSAPSENSGWVRDLTDIKVVGPEAADAYRDAETKFWAKWNAGMAEEFAAEMGLKKPEPKDEDANTAEGNGEASAAPEVPAAAA